MSIEEYTEVDEGWQMHIPLPKLEHAEKERRIRAALGFETKEPIEVEGGWIVRWRARETEGFPHDDSRD